MDFFRRIDMLAETVYDRRLLWSEVSKRITYGKS